MSIVLAIWTGAAVVLLASAAGDAREGERQLEALRSSTDPGELLRGEGGDELRAARRSFSDADAKVSSPVVAPFKSLPVVGRQLRSFDALTSAGRLLLDVTNDSIDEVRAILERDRSTGPARADLVSALQLATAEAYFRSVTVDLGPSEGLINPLFEARADLAGELGDVRDLLTRATAVTTGVAELFRGPRRYLVLASNNAEMQSGWGMPLSAGVLTTAEGDLDLPSMEPTAALRLPPGAVPLTGDLATNWGGLVPNQEWRNLALTPNFDQVGPLAAAMWPATGDVPVDGVLAIDPYGVQAILDATGPVDIEGQSVGAEQIAPLILHDQYVDQSLDDTGRAERQERLSAIAVAAVDALQRPDVDAVALVEGFIEAANQRHILAWSSLEVDQQAWVAGRVDGALSADSMLVSLVNRGGNKLDWFMDVEAELNVVSTLTGSEGTVTVRVANRTPEGQSSYIAGPYPGSGALAAGDYAGVVTMHLPGDALNGRVDGVANLVVGGPDGLTRVIGAQANIARGDTAEYVFRFDLPRNRASVRLEPSARARPVTWLASGREFRDGRGHTLSLIIEP